MGVISITLPIKATGNFRVRDKKFAKHLVEEIERNAERESDETLLDEAFGIWKGQPERVEEVENFRKLERMKAFDEALGIWAGRKETSEELTKRLRSQNNQRNG